MNCKKGFVLYLDNLECIRSLSTPQLGILFRALNCYGMASAEGSLEETPEPAALLDKFPDMDPATVMAYCFMADSIYRDTLKWKTKQRNYCDAAKERSRRSREEVLSELRSPKFGEGL